MTEQPGPTNTLLEDHDYDPTCTIGHPGEHMDTLMRPCTRQALFAVSYHVCPDRAGIPGVGPGTGLWCAHHLAIAVMNSQSIIQLAAMKDATCLCGTHLRTIKDVLTNVNPIRCP